MKMSPKHKDWEKFCELLEGKEGCNFKKNKNEKINWKCKGGNDKSYATAILTKYFPKIDLKKTLKYFDDNGGYCDCEILFNVEK